MGSSGSSSGQEQWVESSGEKQWSGATVRSSSGEPVVGSSGVAAVEEQWLGSNGGGAVVEEHWWELAAGSWEDQGAVAFTMGLDGPSRVLSSC